MTRQILRHAAGLAIPLMTASAAASAVRNTGAYHLRGSEESSRLITRHPASVEQLA